MQPQPEALPQTAQMEIFSVDQVQGYAKLDRKSRQFVQALFEGCTQRQALERAGVIGNDEYLDSYASKFVRRGKVQSVMNQAWAKSGCSIDATLRQAAEVQARAFAEMKTGETAKRREEAFAEWRHTSALIASIHGKLSLRLEMSGSVDVNHVLITPKLQTDLVAQRRTIVRPLENILEHAN